MLGAESLITDLKAGIVRILVIDDDLDICNGLKDILQDAGYLVDTANSGADGFDCLNQQTYSLLVVDYSLPDTNGIEIARMVNRQYAWMQTILMTGHDHVEISKDHETAPLLGAFLRKPIDVQIILSVIEETSHRQCDRFQIPRFTPQPQTEESILPIDLDVSRSKNISWVMAFSILLAGFAGGWFGHGMVNKPNEPAPVLSPHIEAPLVPVPLPQTVVEPKNNRSTQVKKRRPPASPIRKPLDAEPVVAVKAPLDTAAHPDWNAQLESADVVLRIGAAKELLKSSPGHEKAAGTLLTLMRDPDRGHRLASIEAVSVTGLATAPIVAGLADALRDDDPEVAYAAANTLSRVGEAAAPALPALIDVMVDSSTERSSESKAAKNAVVHLGKEATPLLISRLADLAVRGQMIETLGEIGPAAREAIPALTPLESDPTFGLVATKASSLIQPPSP